MEWSFEDAQGAVTVRQEGERAVCQAIRSKGGGLYKAWLRGAGEARFLLGTLIPEGGALRLRRVVEVATLRREGVWPPVGAETALSYAFTPETPPPSGWCVTDCPGRLLEDRALAETLRNAHRGLVRRDLEGFFLALPWSQRRPFPIPALFCLARVEELAGKQWAVFRFSRQGRPELPHNFSKDGENRGVT